MGGHKDGSGSSGLASNKTSTTTTSSVTYLRFMFITLSVACLMQMSYQYGGGGGGGGGGSGVGSSIFGCTTIFYVGNENKNDNDGGNGSGSGSGSSGTTTKGKNTNLRKMDPDVPINSYIKKKKTIKTNPSSETMSSSILVADAVAVAVTNSSFSSSESKPEIEKKEKEINEKIKSKIPKFIIDPLYKNEQDRIDYNITDENRCKQFGVDVLPKGERNKRRIFFGSMLANENSDVLLAHAIEVYNKYDIIALVESNTTHFNTPRTMNFYPNNNSNARTLIESELFGLKEKTNVYIDYWLENEEDLLYMQREVEQRNTIWKRWVKQGMKPNDIGIMADLDEIVSRDFLNSLQVCDYPKLRYDPEIRPDCQAPKMILSSIQFEGSPKCIKQYEWFHPDLILGNCLLDVGDNSGRVIPKRSVNKDSHGNSHLNININKGNRIPKWGSRNYNEYPTDIIKYKRFPLWDGRDIREVNGNSEGLTNYVHPYSEGHSTYAAYGTAYHLHNWFNDLEILRHKYVILYNTYNSVI
jgi:hypothetical protein